jgi:uncharacterized protein YjiS (DUF1127 family)
MSSTYTIKSAQADEQSTLQRFLHGISNRFAAVHERLIIRDTLEELGQLDEFMLRDIGATGDEIYRVHQMRNGQRPTLAVG